MPYACLPETGDGDPAIILESGIHVCKMRDWAQSARRCSFISFPLDCIPIRGVQPEARGLMAMNATQHKIVNLLKTWDFLCVWLRVAMYLMCGPEMPKGWDAFGNEPVDICASKKL